MPIRTSILAAPLLAFLLFACPMAGADELKDVSQLVSQGKHGEALDKVNSYLTSHPGEVQGQFLKGVILAETGKSADAIKMFTDITTKHPELPEPYNNLAVLYADQGQYEKARRALELAIKTHPSYATAHENLGDVYAKMATDAYDKALQLDKNNPRTQTKLAMVKELFSGAGRPVPVVAKAEPVARVTPVAPVAAPAEPVKPVVAPPAAVAEPVKPVAPVVSEPAKEKPESAAKPDPEDQRALLEDTVKGWAKAWSARDVDGYLAYYGAGFKVPNGESRTAWEKSRRERIRAPASIKVELSGIKIKQDDETHATVSFRQSYRAGDLAKRTAKSLVLKKGGNKWFIEQELTDR
jgi:tetratricopeptide (TPR) repeat protein